MWEKQEHVGKPLMSVSLRDSRYEILRIVAAIAITLNHIPCSENALIVNRFIRKFFFLGGQFGVNLYVIIGAWFLCNGKFKSERILRIIAQMVFYSLVLDIVSFALGTSLSFSGILKSFSYWFCFGYVIMLIAVPFLQKLSERKKICIAIVGWIIASIITIGGYIDPSLLLVRLSLKGVIIGPLWFSYVFVLVSLIKEHWDKIRIKRMGWIFIFIFSYALMFIIFISTGRSFIREVCSPICFLSAMGAFGILANENIGSISWINRISGYTFGVYLFQAHMLFRSYLWEGLFHFTSISEFSLLYILDALMSLVVIFAFSAVMEEVRNKIMSLHFINKTMNKMAVFWDGVYHRAVT